ncbi:hypothetical protein V9T40_013956 [Parthenolecanium corni]|uniref:Transcription termination factor 3, mitochondrial n=1 Tax=Parthenolecanium corni TaxID=536013 RepID=A0AAN9TFV0_9HEMI
MKKVITVSCPLTFCAQRSLGFLLPQTCILLNRPRSAQFSTHKPMNMLFEKGDLIITEIASPDKVKRKDSAARPFDSTLQLNSNLDWRSPNAEVVENEKPPTVKLNRAQQRTILFKANTKQLLENYPAAGRLLAVAENIRFPEPVICSMIFANPKITSFNPERVSSNLSQLMNLGFHVNEIKSIVRRYPDILEYEGHDIFDTIEAWRTASLSERFICELFSMHPLLFSIPNDEAVRRLERINYLMVQKINRVKSVIEKNVAIMDGDWNRVEENFEYFYKTMRVTEKDISHSRGLSLPLDFIQLRHTFLEKCGEYIRPKIKEEKGFSDRKNPSLSAILDTSDEVFAVNVAKVSPDEYHVYKALMKRDDVEPSENIFSDT